MPNQSPFHEMHLKSNAEMAEQDGWLVPLHYGDPQAEQEACRSSLAVFDLSHHNRLRISGVGSEQFLKSTLLIEGDLPANGRQMQLKLNGELPLCQVPATLQHQPKSYVLILPGGGSDAWASFLQTHPDAGDVDIQDETASTAMISVQGPSAMTLLKEKLPVDVDDIQANDVVAETMFFMKFILSLDDHTPPGVHLIMPARIAPLAWDALQKYGRDYDARLAGVQVWQSL
jgi:aminomethyltransferase